MARSAYTGPILVCAVLAAGLAIGWADIAVAGSRDQAKRLHDRIAGVPPSAGVLDAMQADIDSGNPLAAADRAMDNSAFYNVTLKNFATPWTNRDQSVFAPFNDYVATVVGMIRDDVPFNQVLSADVLYVGRSNLGLPPYSTVNNDHYAAIEDQNLDLKDVLTRVTQSGLTGLPPDATAGVMTTRAGAAAFFVAGTNRAMLRFTLINHLCTDLEQIKDNTRTPDRIRQDVSRSPGGDSRLFLNSCMGCHAGMDALAGAFAYYNFDATAGRLLYNGTGAIDPATGGRVQAKYRINSDNFKYGYVTIDDSWINYWRSGPNALLGWSGALPGRGNGAKALGTELENTDAFATCQAKKVFKTVCLRPPVDAADRAQIDTMAATLKSGNYNMKRLFAAAGVYCMGN